MADDEKQEPTAVRYGDVLNDPIYLPDGQFDRIHFQLDDNLDDPSAGNWLQLARKTDTEGVPYLELTSSAGVSVQPQSSNVAKVYIMNPAPPDEETAIVTKS